MTDDDALWESFSRTVLVAWDHLGLPRVLSGAFAEDLRPVPQHTITAWDPGGIPTEAEVNAAAHRRLVAEVEAAGHSWEPVVGASPDGAHHEVGILLRDVSRAEAVALGVAHGQLAIFELDADRQVVVPCDGSRPIARQRWRPLEDTSLTFAQVTGWRAEHEDATGHLLPRLRCPSCGATDPARFQFGMPMQMPPDWIAVGGCVVGGDEPTYHCGPCGHDW